MPDGSRDTTRNARARHSLALMYPLALIYLRFFCTPVIRWFEVDPKTLCQFTGFCDKKGKRIWENDVLMAHLDESYPEDMTYETIEWGTAGWVTHETNSIDRQYLDEFDTKHFEVVGSTFDNPELLQEMKNG